MSKTEQPNPDPGPVTEAEAQPDAPQRACLLISGLVQGVYYRSAATEQARVLGLRGIVRNLLSGDVELIAEGPPAVVQQMIDWCHLGPPAARVDKVVVRLEAATGEFRDFRIVRTAGDTGTPHAE